MKKILLNNGIGEIHIPLVFSTADAAQSEFERAAEILRLNSAQVVGLEVCAGSFADSAVADFTRGAAYPVNRILPLDEVSQPVIGGAHITAVFGCVPEFASTADGLRAVRYSDGFFEYCRTFGVVSGVPNSQPYEHTIDNLERLERALGLFGFAYTDIARTWFYNDDILAWYDDFNRARTKFYSDRKIFEKLLPASRRVMVSGTASIEWGGKTAFVGDIQKQVDLTMRVIGAILESRKMDFSDTVRSIVYCRHPEYYRYFEDWAKANGAIAHVPSYSIVCRSDLLFEVELEAAVGV